MALLEAGKTICFGLQREVDSVETSGKKTNVSCSWETHKSRGEEVSQKYPNKAGVMSDKQ